MLRKTFTDLAVEYAYAMLERSNLRRQRRALKCEHFERSSSDDGKYDPGVPECWRETGTPNDEWCDNCKKAQAVHQQLTLHYHKTRSIFEKLKRSAKSRRKKGEA